MAKDQRTNSASSNAKLSQETTGPLLTDLIRDHFSSCKECNPNSRPVSLGQESGLCADYWTMVQDWAQNEGHLNNVVAHDEFGNDAPTHLA